MMKIMIGKNEVNMKKSIFTYVVISLVLIAGVKARAENIAASDIATEDGKVVFAIRPYFSKEDRKHFNLKGSRAKLIPVGLMIQNYSGEKIAIEGISFSAPSTENVFVKNYTPFGDRAVGAIADDLFFRDGDGLDDYLRNKYASAHGKMVLGKNEIFHSPWLEPETAFYGLIYLDKRNNAARPVKIKNLDGYNVNVRFRRGDLSKLYMAMLPLHDLVGSSIRPVVKVASKSGSFQCESPECEKIDGRKIYEIAVAFDECFSKSLAKNGGIKGAYWGEQAWAWVHFDKYGKYLLHDILAKSGNKNVDKSLAKVAKGMDGCEIPFVGGREVTFEEKPFYSVKIRTGDLMSKDENNKKIVGSERVLPAANATTKGDDQMMASVPYDDALLKYRALVSARILRNWIPPATTSPDSKTVELNVFIDTKGEIESIEYALMSGNKDLDDSAVRAVKRASPFPIPPDPLKEEAYKEGFKITFNSPKNR